MNTINERMLKSIDMVLQGRMFLLTGILDAGVGKQKDNQQYIYLQKARNSLKKMRKNNGLPDVFKQLETNSSGDSVMDKFIELDDESLATVLDCIKKRAQGLKTLMSSCTSLPSDVMEYNNLSRAISALEESKTFRETEQMKCVFSKSRRTIIDLVDDNNKTVVKQESLSDCQKIYPDAQIVPLEEAYKATCSFFQSEPLEISEDDFMQAYEVMPSVGYSDSRALESFKSRNLTYGPVTSIYCRVGERYFQFSDAATLSQKDIIERVKNSTAFNQPHVIQQSAVSSGLQMGM